MTIAVGFCCQIINQKSSTVAAVNGPKMMSAILRFCCAKILQQNENQFDVAAFNSETKINKKIIVYLQLRPLVLTLKKLHPFCVINKLCAVTVWSK